MDFPSIPDERVVVTRFPLKSDFGGEEKVIAEFSRHFSVIFWGTCPVLRNLFPPQNRRLAFGVRDITSKKTLLFSPFFALLLLIQAFFWLPIFRFSGVRVILFHTFIEKVFLTPFASLLGFRVFWAHHAPLGKWFFQNPLLPLWRFFSRWATILVPAEFLKKELQKAHPRGKILVVENPITPQKITRKKHKTFTIGGAGRLEKDKRFDEFCALASDFPDINFLIAGNGSEKKRLENIAPKNVIFLGFLDAPGMQDFWGKIDLFLSFSRSETFGMVAAEAASAGIPAVVTDAGGFVEVVQSGTTGIRFKTLKESREAITMLQQDDKKREAMGKSAQQFSARWSAENFAERMQSILFSSSNF